MRHYEIVVLLGSDQHDRGIAAAERYRKMVSDGGGAVHRFEDWGSRTLAYPIGKRLRARYFLFNIECGAETLDQLKDDFRYSELVIRSLVIRREQAIVEESAMLADIKKRAAEEEAAMADNAMTENVNFSAAPAPAPAPAAEKKSAPAASADTPSNTPAASGDDKEKTDEEKK